jgi:catechol 2,3-dioxygenase-like lactoylglutathione lyase family enzyme
MVDNQEKALQFYTDVLGFIKKNDIPMGEARWLTVVSPEGPDDIELLLEPAGEAGKTFQKSLFESGIPLTAFAVDDIQGDFKRLKARGVSFKQEPTKIPGGPTMSSRIPAATSSKSIRSDRR